MMKLKRMIEDLEKLRDGYEELRLLIADQVRDHQIDEAKENLDKLLRLKTAIEQMENIEVNIQ
jgi:hypothetical protein